LLKLIHGIATNQNMKPGSRSGFVPLTSVDIDELIQDESPSFSNLEGNIATSTNQGAGRSGANDERSADGASTFDTLDEPVLRTIKRDLKAVGSKFMHVLYPRQSNSLLRDWDLWGPLFLCVVIALLLQQQEEHGLQFTGAFIITFFGACAVTINVKLLGGTISFFQTLCVLGYCLLPCTAALIVCKVILLATKPTTLFFVLRLIVTVLGFSWATFASTAFLAGSQPPRRKGLAVYPIFLFYFIVSWLIISQTHYGH